LSHNNSLASSKFFSHWRSLLYFICLEIPQNFARNKKNCFFDKDLVLKAEFRIQVDSHTSRFGYIEVVSPTRPWSIRIHRSRFAYIEKKSSHKHSNRIAIGQRNKPNLILCVVRRLSSSSIRHALSLVADWHESSHCCCHWITRSREDKSVIRWIIILRNFF